MKLLYKNILINKEKVKTISEEEFNSYFERIIDKIYFWKNSESSVKENDLVVLNISFIFNEIIYDLNNIQIVIKEDSFYGIEKHLISKKVGNDFTFDIVLPNSFYLTDFRNKLVKIKCKIKSIKEKYKPSIEEIKNIFKCETIEEIKTIIKNDLLIKKQRELENDYFEKLCNEIIKRNNVFADELSNNKDKLKMILNYIIQEEGIDYTQASFDRVVEKIIYKKKISGHALINYISDNYNKIIEEAKLEPLKDFLLSVNN